MTLVVVSNRVAGAKAGEPISGGLAAALIPMVSRYGAIWVGLSGDVGGACRARDAFVSIPALGTGTTVVVEPPIQHYINYYEGFANSALWPALHSRVDLIRVTADHYASYREVNAFMARALMRFDKPDSIFWIHDYHFLPLGAEMRRLGIKRPIGFFLHTPWPDRHCMAAVPHHRDIVQEMLAYDLVGFQTIEARQNFEDYLRYELGMTLKNDTIAGEWGCTQLATFPIGIDVDEFAARATVAIEQSDVLRLRASLKGPKFVLGVDRLDYSKGLANRFRAFGRMLEIEPGLMRVVSFLQVAAPSRGNIRAYRELKADLEALATEINCRHRQSDWTPIRYLNQEFSQLTLAGLYRTAQVGLVTPFRDGMNLVAKEFVAAQNPVDPGVLILSTFAGAAEELDAALLVDPHDVDSMALQIAKALAMTIEERRERWQQMVTKLKRSSLQNWFSAFLNTLSEARRLPPVPANQARMVLP
ncbi:alpha,alpha-trehalose-phosphate synthase (UDP-forming) [Bradyrhizobium erythrophlei]|uniref:Trehalose 6-phosphate synthase n=1 Tax=Bradyrhizobium erythrophlei TaxID=1437360 RepID=A0A1M5U925_9BRAD|nr:trehalose-6-phosphate synthase [Bradyrhizobium erythrophlei]SHH59366.1 trehalose 6-phosphate synthase [Bradyrhizobium erythrophlei]